jgi:hypothetical protein
MRARPRGVHRCGNNDHVLRMRMLVLLLLVCVLLLLLLQLQRLVRAGDTHRTPDRVRRPRTDRVVRTTRWRWASWDGQHWARCGVPKRGRKRDTERRRARRRPRHCVCTSGCVRRLRGVSVLDTDCVRLLQCDGRIQRTGRCCTAAVPPMRGRRPAGRVERQHRGRYCVRHWGRGGRTRWRWRRGTDSRQRARGGERHGRQQLPARRVAVRERRARLRARRSGQYAGCICRH